MGHPPTHTAQEPASLWGRHWRQPTGLSYARGQQGHSVNTHHVCGPSTCLHVSDVGAQSRVETRGRVSWVRVLSPEASRSHIPVVDPQGPKLEDEKPVIATRRETGPHQMALTLKPPLRGPRARPIQAQTDHMGRLGEPGSSPTLRPRLSSQLRDPAGKPAVTGSFPQPLAWLWLMYGPPGSWLAGGTGFINKIYHCNYGSCRELRTFTASWRS